MPMEEVINLDLNLPPVNLVEEAPAQVILEQNEFAFDDGEPLVVHGPAILEMPNPDLEVVIPHLQRPLGNFLVDEVMPDQLIDHEAPPEQVNFSFVQFHSDVLMDPGWASFTARQQSSCLSLHLDHFEARYPEAAKLWKDFFAPPAKAEKVFFVPEDWFNFFIVMLCSPSSFAWALEFIKSRVCQPFFGKGCDIPFLLPLLACWRKILYASKSLERSQTASS